MLCWTIVLAIVIIILVYYYHKKKNVFKKHKVPYAKSFPIIGSAFIFFLRRKPVAVYLQDVYNLDKKSKYVGFYDFQYPLYYIRDPELLKTLTIKHFDHFTDHRDMVDDINEPLFTKNLLFLRGDNWRKMRNLLSPAFTSSKMKGMFKLMINCSENFVNHFIEQAKNNSITVNSKDIFTRYTNDVIATCAFGIDIDSMRDPNNEFYVLGRSSTSFDGFIKTCKFLLIRVSPFISNLFGIRLFGKKVEDFFVKVVEDTIKMREETGFSRPDMIQLMMETRNQESGPKLSILDMTSQAFIFFFGGFDSSSTLMCFAVHEIASNPEIQEKLREEVDNVLDKCDGNLTYEAINGMVYLDAILSEALRMYPVNPMMDRMCTKSIELPPALPGNDPIMLNPGDCIALPIYSFHRDPDYFPDPDKFLPDRFIGKQNASHSPAYIPFGIGPRICIGNRFALLETKVLIFQLVAKCILKPGKQMILPLALSTSSFAMSAQGGFWLELTPRNKSKKD